MRKAERSKVLSCETTCQPSGWDGEGRSRSFGLGRFGRGLAILISRSMVNDQWMRG